MEAQHNNILQPSAVLQPLPLLCGSIPPRAVLCAAPRPQVIQSGKLPLLDCESEGASMFVASGVDSLRVFLKPPSMEVFEVGADSALRA